MSRKAIYDEISLERARQEAAVREHGADGWCSLANPETITEYRLAVLGEEYGEVSKELNEMRVNTPGANVFKLKGELIQLAAVAVAWIEGIDAGWRP